MPLEEASSTVEPTQKHPNSGLNHVIDIFRYSSWSTQLEVTAYSLWFIRLLQKLEWKNVGPSLQVKETMPSRDGSTPVKHHTNMMKSATWQLCLFLDLNSLFRFGRRIHNAPFDHSAKFPVMIRPTHPITKLIIPDTYAKQLHSGVNASITALSQSYCIKSMRKHLKEKQLRQCVICHKIEGAALNAPHPAPLPKVRPEESNQTSPGPFQVVWL